jgi:hypothetical protein
MIFHTFGDVAESSVPTACEPQPCVGSSEDGDRCRKGYSVEDAVPIFPRPRARQPFRLPVEGRPQVGEVGLGVGGRSPCPACIS